MFAACFLYTRDLYIYHNLVLDTGFEDEKKKREKETKADLLHGVSGVGVEDKEAIEEGEGALGGVGVKVAEVYSRAHGHG